MERKVLYTEIPKCDTLKEYIEKLFSYTGGAYSTGYAACFPTFNDEELKELDYKAGRRSFEDIMSIIYSHYPNTTEQEVAKTLYELFEENKMVSLYCSNIKKQVFMNAPQSNTIYKLAWDGFITNGNLDVKGNGQYSIKDVLDLAGHKDNYKIANGEKQLITKE